MNKLIYFKNILNKLDPSLDTPKFLKVQEYIDLRNEILSRQESMGGTKMKIQPSDIKFKGGK